MRTVLKSNHEVAHFWANNVQSEGRTSSYNLFFEGTRIYSYGMHYLAAQWYAGIDTLDRKPIVLINEHRYSPSTGRHLSHIRGASSHLKQYQVSDPGSPVRSQDTMLDRIYDTYIKLLEAKNFKTIQNEVSYLRGLIFEYTEFSKDFKLDYTTFPVELEQLLQEFDAYVQSKLNCPKRLAKIEAKEKERELARRKAEDARKVKRLEDIEKFLKGEVRSVWGLKHDLIRINLKDQLLETSGGADVPLVEALELAQRVQRGEDVTGSKVGEYTVDTQDDTVIKIGCHTIEINEALKQLNLTKGA